jgi:hypothetical protein
MITHKTYFRYYTPPGSKAYETIDPKLERRFKRDLELFDQLVATAASVNTLFTWDRSPSFYKVRREDCVFGVLY